MSTVYALDFDGVLCDSCGESSISAFKAAKKHWPDIFANVPAEMELKILEEMRTVRPVVETGYENLLLVRLLLEMHSPPTNEPSCTPIREGLTVPRLLSSWETIRPQVMEEWGQDKQELVDLFGAVRDRWIEEDVDGWIEANRFYPGTPDALGFSSSSIYIVTTKQTRFALLLLKRLADIDFPEHKIYGLGTGPKVDILKMLQELPENQGASLHFVEDRLATLRNVIAKPELDKWNLYLGDWGYNTETERQDAEQTPKITVIDLPTFCGKLK